MRIQFMQKLNQTAATVGTEIRLFL